MYRALGEKMIKSRDWEHYYDIARDDIIDQGTHAMLHYALSKEVKKFGKYWRSRETVSGEYPFGSWLTNKRWYFNEVSNFMY